MKMAKRKTTKRQKNKNQTAGKIERAAQRSFQSDPYGELAIDEEHVDTEIDDFPEMEDQNDDEHKDELLLEGFKKVHVGDLFANIPSIHKAVSENRISLLLLKTKEGFICQKRGYRVFKYSKKVSRRYEWQYLIDDALSTLGKAIEYFMNGFFSFEEPKKEYLKNFLPSKYHFREKNTKSSRIVRSVFTTGYIRFWDSTVWNLSVLTPAGRVNQSKNAMSLFRIALGKKRDLKKSFINKINDDTVDEDFKLKNSRNNRNFFEKLLEVDRNLFEEAIGISASKLIENLNSSPIFIEIVKKIRGMQNEK